MTPRFGILILSAALALTGCAEQPVLRAVDASEAARPDDVVAPGAEGAYPGDPLAGANLDPDADPLL